MKRVFVYLLLILMITSQSFPQTTSDVIENILQAFKQLDYQSAKEEAQKVIQTWQQYDKKQLLEVHKILGVIAYTEGNLNESQAQFEQALSLDHEAELDSVLISPKIISFFHTIKSEYQPMNATTVANQIRYILVVDSRPGAFLRSLIFPGWGQMYKRQQKKGIALLTVTGVSIVSDITLYIIQKKAHNKYLDATDPLDIENKYDDYNRLNKYWHSSMFVTGATWIYSLADALISKPALSNKYSAFIIQPSSRGKDITLTAIWYF